MDVRTSTECDAIDSHNNRKWIYLWKNIKRDGTASFTLDDRHGGSASPTAPKSPPATNELALDFPGISYIDEDPIENINSLQLSINPGKQGVGIEGISKISPEKWLLW